MKKTETGAKKRTRKMIHGHTNRLLLLLLIAAMAVIMSGCDTISLPDGSIYGVDRREFTPEEEQYAEDEFFNEKLIQEGPGFADIITKCRKEGHDWGEWEEFSQNCQLRRYECRYCNRCHFFQFRFGEGNGSHQIDYREAKEPTCQRDGHSAYGYCINCDYVTGYETYPALGHSWGEWIVKKPPTETELGSKYRVCSRDSNHMQWDTIPRLIHKHTPGDPVEKNRVEAKCTEDGSYDLVIYCTGCNAELSREKKTINKLGHTVVKDPAVDATCTKTGLTEGSHCSVCNEVLKAQEEVPKKEHTIEIDPAVAATCTETGLTEGKHCSVCGEVLIKQAETEKNPENHAGPMKVVEGRQATCTRTGLADGFYCYACKTTVQEVLPIDENNHLIVKVVPGKEPACTKTGLTEGTVCADCKKELKEQTEIPAKGHTVIIDAAVEATCTKSGLTEGSHCSVCNEVLKAQEVIPAKGHTEVTDAAVEATCTKSGLTAGSHCQVCNEVLKAQEVIKALGHTGGTATCKAQAICTRCGEPYGELGAHQYEMVESAMEPTCTDTGFTALYRCVVCEEAEYGAEVIPTVGHQYNEEHVCIWCGKSEYSE